MAITSPTRRYLLLGFIGSIVVCGAVGIYCLLLGSFGNFEARVLGTTASVGAASILGMAVAVPWERRRWHPIGPVGIASVAIALALLLVIIWIDFPWRPGQVITVYQVTGVACVLGVALPHIALLSLARLRPEYAWARRWTVITIVLLAVLVSVVIIFERWLPLGEDALLRMIGVLAIIDVCGTIAIPILHRVSAIRTREDVRTVELHLSVTCPRCDTTQELSVGRSKCMQCALKFLIEIEEENCSGCGYPLYQLRSSACPECGVTIAWHKETSGRPSDSQ